MENTYGQFCTVARGAEVLCERWTPLVVRELLCGSKRFNDLHRGVPRMSTSLLAQRLRRLEEFGVVRRDAVGKVWEYSLTGAGEDLRPIVMALGHWGSRRRPWSPTFSSATLELASAPGGSSSRTAWPTCAALTRGAN